jgi:hypothetical protein
VVGVVEQVLIYAVLTAELYICASVLASGWKWDFTESVFQPSGTVDISYEMGYCFRV